MNTRLSELRIEHKIIIIKIDEASRGALVEITERNRARSFSVRTDLGGVFWVTGALQEAWRRFNEGVFFSKYQSRSALFCLQRFNNKRGTFVELSKWMGGIKRSNIIIPVGVDGHGWLGTAELLDRIIHGGKKGNEAVKVDNKEKAIIKELRSYQTGVNRGQKIGTFRGRSFADLFKDQSLCWPMNSSSVELDHAVVCTRTDFFTSWDQIEMELCRHLKCSVILRPFQLNRALILTSNKEQAEKIGGFGLSFFGKGVAVELESWSDDKHRCPNVIASYGGWIAICDLPFNLLNEKTFKMIGLRCGGLMDVDRRTSTFQNLFEARLKVRGFDSGFLPSTIEVMEGEASVTVRMKPLSKPIRRREVSRPWIFRQDSSVSTIGGRGDETIEGIGRTRGVVEEGRQTVLLGVEHEATHASGSNVFDIHGSSGGDQRILESGPDYNLGQISIQNGDGPKFQKEAGPSVGKGSLVQTHGESFVGVDPTFNLGQKELSYIQNGDGLMFQKEPANTLGLSVLQAGLDVGEVSFVQSRGEFVGVDPTLNLGLTHNRFCEELDLGRTSKLASQSGHANPRASESTAVHSDGSYDHRNGFARIDHGEVATRKEMSDSRSQLNPSEIHLGLADLVDRTTGDLSQIRCSINDSVREDEVEVQRDASFLTKEVEEGLHNPFEVLQALDEYGSSESSEDSSVPGGEGNDGMVDRAELLDPNLDWLFHENQAPDSDSKECAEGKEGDGDSDSSEKVRDSCEQGNMKGDLSDHNLGAFSGIVSGSVLGRGGESHDVPVSNYSRGVASIGEDIVSHVNHNRLDTTNSLVPPAANEEDHRTGLSVGVSPDHGLGVDSVSGTDVDETERWLRKMSKYVSFPLEEGDVPHFVHLLDTLGLSLVKNNGFKSRSKMREFASKEGNCQKSSGHRKGWRELRNLKSDINYEGREKEVKGGLGAQ